MNLSKPQLVQAEILSTASASFKLLPTKRKDVKNASKKT